MADSTKLCVLKFLLLFRSVDVAPAWSDPMRDLERMHCCETEATAGNRQSQKDLAACRIS